MLEVIEYVNVDFVERTVLLKKLAQPVGKIVFLSKLEDRLSDSLAEPYYGFPAEFRCPLARSHQPRRYIACEQARGILVRIE